MATRAEFAAARRAIATALDRNASLCAPFLDVIPVAGIAVSVLSTPAGQNTVCSSDSTAARLDEVQFYLGEGPSWEAMTTRRPVLAGDFDATHGVRWPLLSAALAETPVRGLFAFPLAIGTLDLGAVDLYSRSPRQLTDEEVSDASALADVTAWQVLRRIVADDPESKRSESNGPESNGWGVRGPSSRREVYQATGMVLAQLDISADDALLLLRAHAFSSGRSVREVSADVVARRLVFTPDQL
jgi:hypothetical protein